jgi:hypothetical protein
VDQSDFSDESADGIGYTEADEFPKPNIVKTVRSIFENISQNPQSNCKLSNTAQRRKCSKAMSQLITSSRNDSSVSAVKVNKKSSEPENNCHNQPPILNNSGEVTNSWDEHNQIATGQLTLESRKRLSWPPVVGTTVLKKERLTSSESCPPRKSLYLDFSEVTVVKKGDKARLLPASLLPDHQFVIESQSDSRCTSSVNGSCIPITDVDDLVLPGVTDGVDFSIDSVLREGDPSAMTDCTNRINYEFEGAGIVVDRSLLRKSRSNKQVIVGKLQQVFTVYR